MKDNKEICNRAYVLTWASNTIRRSAISSIYKHIHTFP